MPEELKPCPNAECPKPWEVIGEAGENRFVFCEGCEMAGPEAATEDEAARLWNLLPRPGAQPLGGGVMQEFHYREQLRSVIESYPLWPGDTISHAGAAECARRGWIVRQGNGNWIPTAEGLRVDALPMPKLSRPAEQRLEGDGDA